jgi:hypothetical protein
MAWQIEGWQIEDRQIEERQIETWFPAPGSKFRGRET